MLTTPPATDDPDRDHFLADTTTSGDDRTKQDDTPTDTTD